jgi:hypothetical protein
VAQGTIFTNGVSPDLAEGLYYNQPSGTTQIDGRFQITGGQVSNSGGITVGSTGEYLQYGGATVNTGNLTNLGSVRIGERTLFNNTVGQGPAVGQYTQAAGGTTQIDGTFINSARVANAGEISIGTTGEYRQVPSGQPIAPVTTNSGLFTNAGQVTIAGPSVFVNTGQYIQQAGGTTQLDGTFANRNELANAGSMTIGATGSYVQTGALSTTSNTGTFTNAGSTNIVEGEFVNQKAVINSGTFQVAALGQVAGSGSYAQIAPMAQTIVDGTFSNNIALQSGLLAGTGTITGAVVNTAAVVQPGSTVMPGTLTLASYTQGVNGRLDFKIGGLLAGSQYDVLRVTGPVSLSGTLSATLINNFQPNIGDKFSILRGDRITIGQLNFSLPGLPSGASWLTGIVGDFFTLSVVHAQVSAPEPQSLLLVGVGFAWLIAWQWKRQLAGSKPR